MDAFCPDQALARAQAATGLQALAEPNFREGLERTLSGFAQIPLTPAGRADALGVVDADLAARLRVEAWLKARPQTDGLPIEGPLLVFGLPRTGTTATVAMLALDPRFRFLRGWEGRAPVPPPVAGEEDQDPRVLAARQAAAAYGDSALHLFDPDGPEEDMMLLAGQDMRGLHGRFPMPDAYRAWWGEDSFASTYAYHARVLRLLQSRRPPALWLLKAPVHLWKLEMFAREYPNARFVMTHRDPAQVVASVASLFQTFYERVCEPGAIDPVWTGRHCLAFWSEGMRRGLAARARIGEHRFIDLYNRDLVRDPIGTFEGLYERLGYSIDGALRASLVRYHQQNAHGAFGRHRYAPEDFGLSREAIRAGFADYLQRFGL
jgi:hypothetical protein